MKYEVITDYQKYVQVIRHTGTIRDYVELNLEDYDLTEDRIYAYKLGKNELIFDEAKYQEILEQKQKEENEKEIEELTEELNATDENLLGFVEDMFSLKNPLTFISDLINLMKKYSMLVSARQTIRQRIKELQNETFKRNL